MKEQLIDKLETLTEGQLEYLFHLIETLFG